MELGSQEGLAAGIGCRGLPDGTFVKNTFLEFAEEGDDPFIISPSPLRQKTDSLLDRSSHSRQSETEMGKQCKPPWPCGLSQMGAGGGEECKLPWPHGLCQAMRAGPAAPSFASSLLASGIGPLDIQRSEGRPLTLADLLPGELAVQERAMPSGGPPSRGPTNGSSFKAQITEEEPEELPDKAEEMSSFAFGSEEDVIISSQVFLSGSGSSQEAAREVAQKGGGMSGFTTVMVREIPEGYTQRKFMREIDSMGYVGKYDFLYLPIDSRSKASRGFAFINFDCPATAEHFYRQVHGGRLRHLPSENPLVVVPADVQGFEANAAHFASLQVSKRKKRMPHNCPFFFRKLPVELADAGEEAAFPTAFEPPAAPTIAACPKTEAGYARPARVQAEYAQAPWPNSPADALDRPPPARAPRPPARFCCFCGKPKEPDHLFCPYCGGRAVL